MTAHRQENASIEEEASAAFFGPTQGEWTQVDQTALESRLASDPTYAAAYRRVENVWNALESHKDSPELIARREEALRYARHVSGRRWLKKGADRRAPWRAAAAIATVAVFAAVWQLSPHGYRPGRYHTDIGEQRILELPDHSRIDLDAATTVRVRYSDTARIIDLAQGQAQFSVAPDPVRPFRVRVGDRTIVALGTVFTVDYTGQKVRVSLVEGRVAITPGASVRTSSLDLQPLMMRSDSDVPALKRQEGTKSGIRIAEGSADPANGREVNIELSAGQELRVGSDGRSTLIPDADIEAATAWRERKVIFRTEPLGEAVQRLNRYSRVRIEIADPTLAVQEISGVFDIGDTQGFVRDIQRYLTVTVDDTGKDTITLRAR